MSVSIDTAPVAPTATAMPAFDRWLRSFAELTVTIAIAAMVTVVPVAAHGIHAGLGIFTALLLAAVVAWRLPQVALVAILFSFLFQNLFVSLMSGFVRSETDFDIIRAYNFLILCVTWLVVVVRFLANWNMRVRAIDPYVKVSVALMVAIGLYFLVGFVFNGMTAVIYLRNIVTPLLLFQICLALFSSYEMRISSAIAALGVLGAVCGLFEFAARDAWLAWTNGYGYWELAAGGPNWATLEWDKATRETGRVIVGLTDTFTIDFFNSPLLADIGIRMMRLFGPNMHAISFSYALSFFTIFALFRGRFIQAAVLLFLVFLCNAKGPMILIALTGVGWVLFRLFGAGFAFLVHAVALCCYAVIGVIVGLRIGDFHVLGLMAALHEFPLNPIGYGIGTAGNLSPQFTTIDWYEAQAIGRTPFPVESSIGVLMHQMGVFALAIVAAYVWLGWRVMRIARETGNALHAAAALALLAVVANGLFQEEAFFAPLALALYLGLAGMIIGAAARTGLEERIRG